MIYVPWPVPVPQTFFGSETRRLVPDEWPRCFCFLPGLWLRWRLFLPLDDDRPRPPRCDLLALFTLRYLLAETLDFNLNDISDRFFGQREIGFHARLCLGFFLFIPGVLESFGCFGSHALKIEIIRERIGTFHQ